MSSAAIVSALMRDSAKATSSFRLLDKNLCKTLTVSNPQSYRTSKALFLGIQHSHSLHCQRPKNSSMGANIFFFMSAGNGFHFSLLGSKPRHLMSVLNSRRRKSPQRKPELNILLGVQPLKFNHQREKK